MINLLNPDFFGVFYFGFKRINQIQGLFSHKILLFCKKQKYNKNDLFTID